MSEIETLIADINGDEIQEKRSLWERLKHLLNEALELGNGMADEMREDAERWEREAEEKKRLESPAGHKEHTDHCQQHG